LKATLISRQRDTAAGDTLPFRENRTRFQRF
jgi:hypothetical protein